MDNVGADNRRRDRRFAAAYTGFMDVAIVYALWVFLPVQLPDGRGGIDGVGARRGSRTRVRIVYHNWRFDRKSLALDGWRSGPAAGRGGIQSEWILCLICCPCSDAAAVARGSAV